MHDATNFREQVIELLRRVPRGRLVTYGQLARVLGRPRASRVVGGFLWSLPSEDRQTPWQRVVNRDGRISKREDPFSDISPTERHHEALAAEGLEPDLQGAYSLKKHGMKDHELRALFGCEMLELVDQENRVIGVETRKRVRAENLLHRGVGILCWNSQKELYVHQRTDCKDLFPSYYDMMVGGALAAGEQYEAAALREVQEELGVGNVPINYILETLYEGPKNRSWIQLFEVTWDGPVVWQPEEIAWGRWMPFDEVLTWVDKVPIVPDGYQVFQDYLKQRL